MNHIRQSSPKEVIGIAARMKNPETLQAVDAYRKFIGSQKYEAFDLSNLRLELKPTIKRLYELGYIKVVDKQFYVMKGYKNNVASWLARTTNSNSGDIIAEITLFHTSHTEGLKQRANLQAKRAVTAKQLPRITQLIKSALKSEDATTFTEIIMLGNLNIVLDYADQQGFDKNAVMQEINQRLADEIKDVIGKCKTTEDVLKIIESLMNFQEMKLSFVLNHSRTRILAPSVAVINSILSKVEDPEIVRQVKAQLFINPEKYSRALNMFKELTPQES